MNPVLSVAQMGVTEFWKSLQALSTAGKAVRTRLDLDKLRLQNAFSATRKDTNAARARSTQEALKPLIHKNSELRMQYAGLISKFNQAVQSAGDALKRGGLKAPALSGMSGIGEVATTTAVVVSVVAISLLGAAWAIYYSLHDQSAKQKTLIDAALKVMNDPNASDAEREQARKDILAATREGAGKSDPLGLGNLVPVAALLALALFGPSVLQRFQRRPS